MRREKSLDPLCSKTSSEGKIRIFSEHFRKIQKSCGNDKIKRQGRVIAWTLIHTSSYINKHHRHFFNSMFNRSSSGEKLEMVVPDLKVERVWKKLCLIFSFLFFPLLLSLSFFLWCPQFSLVSFFVLITFSSVYLADSLWFVHLAAVFV